MSFSNVSGQRQQPQINQASHNVAQAPQQRASILNNPTVEFKLLEFLQYCPGVNEAQMRASVENGEKLAEAIKNNDTAAIEHKPEAVKDLMWFLMAKTAENNPMFTSGSIRIMDPGDKIQTFIRECGKGVIYERISTHMNEHLEKGEKQSGFDLRNMGMPANKRTLLFHRLPDGSLFLKMEEKGCPPFLNPNFRNWSNFKEYMGHVGTTIITRFKKSGIGIKQTRKEHVDKNTKKAFAEILKNLKNQSFSKGHLGQEVKKGQKHGLSEMERTLQKRERIIAEKQALGLADNKDSEDQQLIDDFRKAHLQSVGVAKLKGYEGDIKGNEVYLASL